MTRWVPAAPELRLDATLALAADGVANGLAQKVPFDWTELDHLRRGVEVRLRQANPNRLVECREQAALFVTRVRWLVIHRRRQRARIMRLAGLSLREIGRRMGVSTTQAGVFVTKAELDQSDAVEFDACRELDIDIDHGARLRRFAATVEVFAQGC